MPGMRRNSLLTQSCLLILATHTARRGVGKGDSAAVVESLNMYFCVCSCAIERVSRRAFLNVVKVHHGGERTRE